MGACAAAASAGDGRVAGWFGKLPALGDFASRRLDPAFIQAWDDWLGVGLAALKREPDWPAAYLASPSWRFLLAAGVLPGAPGRSAWAGVLMPSVDRVGRYFPLTLALPLPALPADAASAGSVWQWLRRLDDTAAGALQEDWSIEVLERALQQLPAPDPGRQGAPNDATSAAAGAVRELRLMGLPDLPNAAGTVSAPATGGAAAQAAAAWRGRMLGKAFWSATAESAPPRLLWSAGLERRQLVRDLLGTLPHNAG